MSEELYAPIISAIAVGISAILSLISICLTNKNTKAIKLLDRSNNVKTAISTNRYETYQKLINYINSWYNIQPELKHNYSRCLAKNNLIMAIFRHRINNINDLEKELKTVIELSLNYFYYDSKTINC